MFRIFFVGYVKVQIYDGMMIIKKMVQKKFLGCCFHGVPVSFRSSIHVQSFFISLKFPFMMFVGWINQYWSSKGIHSDIFEPINPLDFTLTPPPLQRFINWWYEFNEKPRREFEWNQKYVLQNPYEILLMWTGKLFNGFIKQH